MSAAMVPAQDISTPTKLLYVAVHCTLLPDIMDSSVLAPRHVMACDKHRAWIPLNTDPSEALVRASWGAEENCLAVVNPKVDSNLLRIEFPALGFGHYYLTNVLTKRTAFELNTTGQSLATVQLCVVD